MSNNQTGFPGPPGGVNSSPGGTPGMSAGSTGRPGSTGPGTPQMGASPASAAPGTPQLTSPTKDTNTAMLCRMGQESTQELIAKAIDLFAAMKSVQVK